MLGGTIVADGSSAADAHPRVQIDLTNDADRWRYRCPNNHTRWTEEGAFVLCQSCAELDGVSPVYRELLDARDGETIPWSAVVLEG